MYSQLFLSLLIAVVATAVICIPFLLRVKSEMLVEVMTSHKDGTLPPQTVFVFGSNLAGRHEDGAAKIALDQFGAVSGIGHGRTGNAYAIPIQNEHFGMLSLDDVRCGVRTFLRYAEDHLELRFFVTRVGCEMGGFTDAEIAPMFRGATVNCDFPEEWLVFLWQNKGVITRTNSASLLDISNVKQ